MGETRTGHHGVPFLEGCIGEEFGCVIRDEGLVGFELDDFGWDCGVSVTVPLRWTSTNNQDLFHRSYFQLASCSSRSLG